MDVGFETQTTVSRSFETIFVDLGLMAHSLVTLSLDLILRLGHLVTLSLLCQFRAWLV